MEGPAAGWRGVCHLSGRCLRALRRERSLLFRLVFSLHKICCVLWLLIRLLLLWLLLFRLLRCCSRGLLLCLLVLRRLCHLLLLLCLVSLCRLLLLLLPPVNWLHQRVPYLNSFTLAAALRRCTDLCAALLRALLLLFLLRRCRRQRLRRRLRVRLAAKVRGSSGLGGFQRRRLLNDCLLAARGCACLLRRPLPQHKLVQVVARVVGCGDEDRQLALACRHAHRGRGTHSGLSGEQQQRGCLCCWLLKRS